MDSVRRSSSLLRQTWGEQLISGIAFGWLGLLFAIPGVVLGVLGANGYPIFIAPAIAWFATLVAAFTAAREIFTVALYRYATTGEPPSGYDEATLGTRAAAEVSTFGPLSHQDRIRTDLCDTGAVRGSEFLRNLRRLARRRGVHFQYEPSPGKGSHGRRDLGIEPREL